MKYSLLTVLLLSIYLLGCNSKSSTKTPETLPEIVVTPTEGPKTPLEVSESSTEVAETVGHEPSTPIGPEYPVKDVKKVFTVKIISTNYTAAEVEKLKKAEDIISKVMNSEYYKNFILNRKFTNTLGLTNQQIYDKLFAGAEALIPAINYQMDLTVEGYYSWKNTVGYTTPGSMKVFTNRKFHSKYKPCDVASNLMHEWTHKMGFDHSSAGDIFSVPYSHNSVVWEFCELHI